MRVIVTTVDFPHAYPPKGVRKCPPNYKPKDNEWVIEVDDYTEEDIKEYFPEAEEQFISLVHDEDEGVHEC